MAGFLMSHGVLVALALALAMAVLTPGSVGAEPGHHVVHVASNVAGFTRLAADGSTVEVGDANHPSNPIRMPTDEPKEVAMPNKSEQSAMLPQPDGTVKVPMPPSTVDTYEAASQAPPPPAGVPPPPGTPSPPPPETPSQPGAPPPPETPSPPGAPPPPPAEAPAPCGSTSIAVSLLACVGMALLCLVLA